MQNIDCSKCENRGKIDGLSQETFCDGCIHYGNQWKKDYFKEKGTNEMTVCGSLAICGLIVESDDRFSRVYIEEDGGNKVDLIGRISAAVYNYGRTVSVRYWISSKKLCQESIKEQSLLYIMGLCESDYKEESYSYSEHTYGTDYKSILNIGGHNLYYEIISNSGKYIVLEIDFVA